MERREAERYVVPEIYREYVTFKVREVSGDFVDAVLLNFSPNGIRIKSRYELPYDSTIECLISVPKPLTEEIPFTGKIKYCIQEEPMGDYRCGVKFIDISPEAMNKLENFLRSLS